MHCLALVPALASPSIKPIFFNNRFNELSEDPLFIEWLTLSKELYTTIRDGMWNQDISPAELNRQLEALKNTDYTDEEGLKKINETLFLSPDKGIDRYFTAFHKSWTALKEKYGGALTEEYLTVQTNKAYENNPDLIVMSRHAPFCRDKAKYVACSAGVTAQAMLMHAGCVGTGFFAWLCFALVASYQVNGIADCAEKHCDPIKK